MRLDIMLVMKQMVESREKAQQLIKKGAVQVNGKILTKTAAEVTESDQITVEKEALKYVSRGGYKLEKALQTFKINVEGLRLVDAGASTGGFTDCLLQHGASKVYAIDVGTHQLHESLRKHPCVLSLENKDIRSVEINEIEGEVADALVADLSFISLDKVLETFMRLTKPDAWWILLVKPQFETGTKRSFKKGIIKSKGDRERILQSVLQKLKQHQLIIKGITETDPENRQKNVEYLLYVERT